MTETIDIGDNHTIELIQWSPDRKLNPQYKDIPDISPIGAIVNHKKPDGSECFSGVYFDLPNVEKIIGKPPLWHVEQLEPLTLSPSILCLTCGDHGFIRNGKWVKA